MSNLRECIFVCAQLLAVARNTVWHLDYLECTLADDVMTVSALDLPLSSVSIHCLHPLYNCHTSG